MAITFLLSLVLCAPALAQVSAGTASGFVTHRVDVQLPERGPDVPDHYKIECKVIFTVNAAGDPVEVKVFDCPGPFAKNAEEAARQWRFAEGLAVGGGNFTYTARLAFQKLRVAEDINIEMGTTKVAEGGGEESHDPEGQVRVLFKAEPEISETERIQGRHEQHGLDLSCKVLIRVGADGVPVGAEVVTAPDFLRPALGEAAMKWRFAPVVAGGQPQPFTYSWSWTWVGM